MRSRARITARPWHMPALPASADRTPSAPRFAPFGFRLSGPAPFDAVPGWHASSTTDLLAPLITVFLAYFIAGKLGQATSEIRSSNLGPVWPAYGIALASFLTYGYRVWPAVMASAFVVAVQGSVSFTAAAGQATGATLGAMSGTFVLCRIPGFGISLSRLKDALGFIVLGAFGSALVSSGIGVASLYA